MPLGGRTLLLAASLCATALLGVGYCYYNDADEDEEDAASRRGRRGRRRRDAAHTLYSRGARGHTVLGREQLVPATRVCGGHGACRPRPVLQSSSPLYSPLPPLAGPAHPDRPDRPDRHAGLNMNFISPRLDRILNTSSSSSSHRSMPGYESRYNKGGGSSRILLYKSIYAVRDLRRRSTRLVGMSTAGGEGSASGQKMRTLRPSRRSGDLSRMAAAGGRGGAGGSRHHDQAPYYGKEDLMRGSGGGSGMRYCGAGSWADHTTSWESQLLIVKRVTYQCIA